MPKNKKIPADSNIRRENQILTYEKTNMLLCYFLNRRTIC